jgi:hypothetical protein
MEMLALYIAIIALFVAVPGTIDATWNVIVKLRALKKDDSPRPTGLSKKDSLAPTPRGSLAHLSFLSPYTFLKKTY